jgi:hypothetical protein
VINMVSDIEDGPLDIHRRECTNIITAEIGGQAVLGVRVVGEVFCLLRKLDIIFTPKNSV